MTQKYRSLASAVLAAMFLVLLPAPGRAQTCPAFRPLPVYPVGSVVRGIASADFDGDNRPDLAVANANSNNVTVLTRLAQDTAPNSNTYNVGTFPIAIAVADFNGDGKTDIVTGNNSTSNVSLLLNNGTGGFTSGGTFAATAGPRAIVVGDFNGDGRLDLAVGGQFSIAVLPGSGQGSFGSPIEKAAPTSYLDAADFNGDGKLDLAVGNGSVQILLGNGLGGFPLACGAGSGDGVAAADLNSDGKTDLVVANVLAAKIHVRLGDGTGCFASSVDTDVFFAGRPRRVTIGDLNGDSKLDIIAGTTVMLGDGTGSFGAPVFYGSGSVGEPEANTAVADFDADGRLDIGTGGNGTAEILFGDGAGGFRFSTGPSGRGAYGLARADFNADGKLDVVALSSGNVTRLLGDGAGGFGPGVIIPVPSSSSFFGPVVADFNRDTKSDVAVLDATANGPGGQPRFHVLLGDGAGGFGPGISTSFNASQPAALASADFNADGNPDVLSVNRGGGNNNEGSIAVALGDGAGHFGAATILSVRTPPNPKSVGIADFNGDNKLDLAVPSGFGFSVLLGNGLGSFSPRVHLTTANASSIVVADFNGDGKSDLGMLSEETNGKLSFVLGDGAGGFGAPTQFTVASFPSDLALGDFNRDGKIDVATSHAVQNAGSTVSGISVMIGDGTGNFGQLTNFISHRGPEHLVTGDLNNDGNIDIITANVSFNNLSVLINSCSGPAPSLINFSSSSFTGSEGANLLSLQVNRTGDTASQATVTYATSDSAGLSACDLVSGVASERCDYVTSVGTLTFLPGETQKTLSVPLVDDGRMEGNEIFTVTLSSATGANLGLPHVATASITDNDTGPQPNPIDGVEFFIRQQYLDILNRQPDSVGFQNWVNTLSSCPNGGFGEPSTSNCDRLHVAAGFFQSDEFLNRGYFAFRFYMVSFNQRPTYAQFIPDMAKVGGPKSPSEEEASKVAFADAFVQRAEFLARYAGLSGQPLANALLTTAGLPSGSYNAAGQTNGQILRGIAETSAAFNRFLTEGTVSILYFGFQRRDPDAVGYQNNVDTLNANPNNLRHLIFIFIYSHEYRGRFGTP